jgi:extracellular matrix regulatory protein A
MMIQVGFDNYVSLESIRAVGHPGPAPMTRLVSQSRERGLLVDFTAGRRCKAILVLDSGQVVLSSLTSDTIARRVREAKASRPPAPGVDQVGAGAQTASSE